MSSTPYPIKSYEREQQRSEYTDEAANHLYTDISGWNSAQYREQKHASYCYTDDDLACAGEVIPL